MSAVLHEVAHGYVAFRLGDNTAKDLGRLTLNPLKHLDPIGSVLLPVLMIFSGLRFFIAWAKPVPFNPFNLRDAINGPMKVALAGPLTNLALVIIFGVLALLLPVGLDQKFLLVQTYLSGDNNAVLALMAGSLLNSLYVMTFIICLINGALFAFNLIPVPPLDGSKVLLRFLPSSSQEFFYRYETYGFFVLIFLLWFGVIDIILMPIISVILSVFF